MNKLIVESHNDKFFIQRILKHLDVDSVDISEPLCNIDEYICLDGINNLKNKLRDLKLDDIDRLGIILDADEVGITKRLEEINATFDELSVDVEFDSVNKFEYDSKLDLKVACHILQVDGSGDLDVVIKHIANSESTYADCLDSWRECIKESGKQISDKNFLKFWINNYIRFDTCSPADQKQSFKKCSFQRAMQKDVWNLEHEVLDGLKQFLSLFGGKV